MWLSERGERGRQMATERQLWVGLHTVACVALLVGLLGSAHPVQQGLLGKAPTLSSARYRITLETPQTIFQRQDAAVVVRVQNEQGLPVDGLRVALQVDPPWARYASIRPARARTQGGRVHAILWSALVGQVRITVRVGALTKQATITVVTPIATGYGHADTCRSRPEATDVLLGLN
jgi:hypothetical protein